jgi:hypothetical protein
MTIVGGVTVQCSIHLSRRSIGALAAFAALTVTAWASSSRISTPSIQGTIARSALAQASSGNCLPAWRPTFGGEPGTNGDVLALGVFDAGGGPELYAGGSFTAAGGVLASYIARWNGSTWSPLPGTSLNGYVRAMTVFDDGSGPALYVGGDFTVAGSCCLAKWNGSSWSALGSGFSNPGSGVRIESLLVFDDGSGNALYAGGIFSIADGVPANTIAKWNGSSWSALAGGIGGLSVPEVAALAVFDDGGGSALYVGGHFTTAGAVTAKNIAKWDGTSWSALGNGITGSLFSTSASVRALAVFDDGGGAQLYVGGAFTTAGTIHASCIAKWDGASWSAVGSGGGGVDYIVHALSVFDDGGGVALFAGGEFSLAGGNAASEVAKWNGSTWTPLGNGIGTLYDGEYIYVYALRPFDDGNGQALYVGGDFRVAGAVGVDSIAKWSAASWSRLGSGINNPVETLCAFDDGPGGTGPALYVGGDFTTAGGIAANYIAKWNGTSWSALDSGVNGSVLALAAFDDGGGPALFAGGEFSRAGGIPAQSIAKWDGASWSPLGAGIAGEVDALASFDDGSGPALYAGGYFMTSIGAPANFIARWNGSIWSPVGDGLNWVHSLAVYDDGTGSALFAGGSFGVKKWNGSSWSAVDIGMVAGFPYALAVFDDGSGAALYVGGSFSSVSGVPVNYIAKWNGSSWSDLAGGMSQYATIHTLTSFDDGSGPALYAGGGFTTAGGIPAKNIAKWNGSAWSALGDGLFGGPVALTAFDDGSGSALFAGGYMPASPAGDSFLAKWGHSAGCGMPGVSMCEPGASGVIACPCANAPSTSGVGCNNSANTGGAQLTATGIARLSYDTVVFTTSGEKPTATSIVLQGTSASSGAVFGQGVRCVGGSLKRLYTKTASGGSITAPQGTDLHVHARSSQLGDTIAPGTHRWYGVYYRDPSVLGGCPSSSTFNITQQLDVLWSS